MRVDIAANGGWFEPHVWFGTTAMSKLGTYTTLLIRFRVRLLQIVVGLNRLSLMLETGV